MIKNQANIYQFVLRDMIGQGVTGLSPTVQIRKDSGTFAAATKAVSEVSDGLYELTLTATECNCDIMAIKVTLPDGQFPAILENERLITTGGATPAEIWQYNGGRTVDNTIPSALDNASAVWSAQTKEITINATQAATLAAASDLDSVATKVELIKAKTDNLPAKPAAVGSAMTLTEATVTAVKSGLATGDNIDAALGAMEMYGDTNWMTADVSGLSTFNASTDAVTLTDAYDAAKTASQLTTSDLSALATSADLTALASVANDTLAGMLYWRVVDDTLITYGSNGSIRGQYTITKDSTGNIIKIEPIPSNDGN